MDSDTLNLYLTRPVVLVQGKAPVRKDWPNHTVTREEFEALPDAGLGVKLGPQTLLVDIEEDSFEAGQAWDDLSAGIRGLEWNSARGRHHLFTFCDGDFDDIDTTAFKRQTGIEIRASAGMQSVLPPTGGRTWIGDSEIRFLTGDIPSLPDFILNALPIRERDEEIHAPLSTNRPGDIYNAKGSWHDLLDPLGWKWVGESSDIEYLKRPGTTTQQHSATIGFCKTGNGTRSLFIFSDAPAVAPLEANRTYSLFEARAVIHHAGDFSACSAELVRSGYVAPVTITEIFDDVAGEAEPTLLVRSTDSGDSSTPPAASLGLDPSCYNNLIGEYVLSLEGRTKGDLNATLFQAWEMFGALIGKNAFYEHDGSIRYLHDFLMVVGETGSGKGQSFNRAKKLFQPDLADTVFADNGDMQELANAYAKINVGRFGSGEGLGTLMQRRADPLFQFQANGQSLLLGDQYLGCVLLTEQEASGQLKKILADESTLGDHFLKAWDANALSNQTKNSSYFAPKPVVTFIGHVVPQVLDELPRNLLHSGLINRFKFIHCPKGEYRKIDPYPADLLLQFQERMARVMKGVMDRRPGVLEFSTAAEAVRESIERFQHGLTGNIASTHERYTAHVERSAARLCMLRGGSRIEADDMNVAWEMQKYIFTSTELLLPAMRSSGEIGMAGEKIMSFINTASEGAVDYSITRSRISVEVFRNNTAASEITKALEELVAAKMLHKFVGKPKGGRKSDCYRLPDV